MSQWISIKDGMPEIESEDGDCSATVLIFMDGRKMISGFYCIEDEAWYDDGGDIIDSYLHDVTHWMQLPEPPED